MDSFLGFSALGSELGGRVGAEIHVSLFLANNIRIFDDAGERQISTTEKLLELEATHAIDQKTEDSIVFPSRNLAAKSFHVALLVGSAKRVRNIDTDVPRQTSHLSKVIHFLGSGARDNQLIELRGGVR